LVLFNALMGAVFETRTSTVPETGRASAVFPSSGAATGRTEFGFLPSDPAPNPAGSTAAIVTSPRLSGDGDAVVKVESVP